MLIGELADRLGVNTKTIRFYESFGLIPAPERTSAGYRVYTEEDAGRLQFIKEAQHLGLSLNEISEVLAFRERGERPCSYVLGVIRKEVGQLEERVKNLRSLRRELVDLLEQAEQLPSSGDDGFCPVISHRSQPTSS